MYRKANTMEKIFFDNRDSITAVDVDMIAAAQADGNYTKVVYINKRETTLPIGIGKFDEKLKAHNSRTNRFIRLGRSMIVNHAYFYRIDLLRTLLILADNEGHELRIKLSKKLLKPYKDAIVERIRMKKGDEI